MGTKIFGWMYGFLLVFGGLISTVVLLRVVQSYREYDVDVKGKVSFHWPEGDVVEFECPQGIIRVPRAQVSERHDRFREGDQIDLVYPKNEPLRADSRSHQQRVLGFWPIGVSLSMMLSLMGFFVLYKAYKYVPKSNTPPPIN